VWAAIIPSLDEISRQKEKREREKERKREREKEKETDVFRKRTFDSREYRGSLPRV